MIRYRFQFEENSKVMEFSVDPERNSSDFSQIKRPEEWAKLDFHKCSLCTLQATQFPHCPVALDLQEALIAFKDARSFDTVLVEAQTPERTVTKRCDFQSGFQSYMGLVMALSACPTLSKFRGAALYHLPFASLNETIFRNVGFYLLKQHFLQKNGEPADFALRGLVELYNDVNVVNEEFQNRLRKVTEKDGSLNAIINWWSRAALLTSIDDMLAQFEPLFVRKKVT